MAKVIDQHGKVTEVKNLGWLLRNWKRVTRFEVGPARPDSKYWHACHLTAFLAGGGRYECHWADKDVCKDWLHRPVFRTLPVLWFGEDRKC
jgi:hypothetical protein